MCPQQSCKLAYTDIFRHYARQGCGKGVSKIPGHQMLQSSCQVSVRGLHVHAWAFCLQLHRQHHPHNSPQAACPSRVTCCSVDPLLALHTAHSGKDHVHDTTSQRVWGPSPTPSYLLRYPAPSSLAPAACISHAVSHPAALRSLLAGTCVM